MTENAYRFFMCPPFEIEGKGKHIIVAKKGHFEISRNKIVYKLANSSIDALILYPLEGVGQIKKIPFEIDSLQILQTICKGITEICLIDGKNSNKSFIHDFIYGDLLPFTHISLPSGFFKLAKIHPNIFEEFYRLTESLEDTITTTLATFDKNIFIPFKQKVIGTYYTDGKEKEEKAATALKLINEDFPRFINFHQNLQTILNSQAKQITDHQQLSFTILNPLVRKIRMLSILKDYLELEEKKSGFELKLNPIKMGIYQIAERIKPIVKPR